MFNFKEFQKYEINNILTKYIKKIQDYDQYFFENRDKERFKVIKKCNRTVNTEIGLITYNRRIYWDNLEKKYCYFTDECFNIEKKSRIINDLKKEILNNLTENLITKKTYRHIQSEFKYTKFSKNLISRIFKNANIQKIIPEQKYKVLDNQKLYINVDDAFISCWDKNNKKQKYCCRIFSMNTGKKEIYSYRNKLQNKITTFLLFPINDKNLSQDKVYEYVYNTINTHYDININYLRDLYWQNPNLVVAGDGALWIKSISRWLGCNYILDKYHAFSYLWKSFVAVKGKKKDSTDWNKYIDSTTNFANGNYNQLITMLENNVNKQTFNYFKSNKIGIENQNSDWNNGCSAESDVYHFLKSLTNGAKIYSYKTLNNMLIAKANYLNNNT